MRTRSQSTLRTALELMSVRLVLQQICLALLVFALYVVWLRVPDASVFDVVGSVCLALIVIWVAGAGESAFMLRLAGRPRTPGRLLRGTLLLLAGTALWLGWIALLGHLRGDYNQNDDTLAGYLNSKFPHGLRYFFTYEHIRRWIGWLWQVLGWIVAGVIAAFVFAFSTGARPIRAMALLMRSIVYWAVVMFVAAGTTWPTGALMRWTPGHGLRVETLSLALRLATVVLVDAAAVCLLLATLAAGVRRADVTEAPHTMPAGTPDTSQPRTAEAP